LDSSRVVQPPSECILGGLLSLVELAAVARSLLMAVPPLFLLANCGDGLSHPLGCMRVSAFVSVTSVYCGFMPHITFMSAFEPQSAVSALVFFYLFQKRTFGTGFI